MATSTTRSKLAKRRASDRDRQRRKAERDRVAGVPTRRVIAAAIARSLGRVIAHRYEDLAHVEGGSDAHLALREATTVLREAGYAVEDRHVRELFRRELGLL